MPVCTDIVAAVEVAVAAETSVDALAAGHVPELDTYQERKSTMYATKLL